MTTAFWVEHVGKAFHSPGVFAFPWMVLLVFYPHDSMFT